MEHDIQNLEVSGISDKEISQTELNKKTKCV